MGEITLKGKRFSEGHDGNRRRQTPSHGENRGSSPLGSANNFNGLSRRFTGPAGIIRKKYGKHAAELRRISADASRQLNSQLSALGTAGDLGDASSFPENPTFLSGSFFAISH
jgi:hypothetical protein